LPPFPHQLSTATLISEFCQTPSHILSLPNSLYIHHFTHNKSSLPLPLAISITPIAPHCLLSLCSPSLSEPPSHIKIFQYFETTSICFHELELPSLLCCGSFLHFAGGWKNFGEDLHHLVSELHTTCLPEVLNHTQNASNRWLYFSGF
jgi:hypothetical protein